MFEGSKYYIKCFLIKIPCTQHFVHVCTITGLSTQMQIKKHIKYEFSEFTLNSNQVHPYTRQIAIVLFIVRI